MRSFAVPQCPAQSLAPVCRATEKRRERRSQRAGEVQYQPPILTALGEQGTKQCKEHRAGLSKGLCIEHTEEEEDMELMSR